MNEGAKKSLRTAVALRYQAQNDRAPRVTAKGKGGIADRIIQLAMEHDIPIKNDPDLVQVLHALDLESEIPAALFTVVAEIFAFVYSLNKQYETHQSAG